MPSTSRIFLTTLVLLQTGLTSAWQLTQYKPNAVVSSSRLSSRLSMSQITPSDSSLKFTSRRLFLVQVPTTVAVASSTLVSPAYAITSGEARDQWKSSLGVIDSMLENWSALEKKGGDAIRVELGTQGTTSPLFQIDKALRALRDEAEDLVEFTEQSEEFQLTLSRADSMAYSANFAGGSGKPTPPAVYIEKSKKEVIELQRIAKALTALL